MTSSIKNLWHAALKELTPHAIAVAFSALTIANTDWTRLENYVTAVAPTVIAAGFNWVRHNVLNKA